MNFDATQIIEIYTKHLQVPSNSMTLQSLREKGSRPIVFIIVDDLHVFMDICADTMETNQPIYLTHPKDKNGLYYFLTILSQFLAPAKNTVCLLCNYENKNI